MEAIDSLKRDDRVAVSIYGPDGTKLYEKAGSGYHSLETAIETAVADASIAVNPEDCTFEVANETTGVTHSYRLNAHGNLKLIV